tara:strand:+ start:804 stop:1532 length:729 start_codon:yes stop_codon:yes gene_type:complete
MTSTQTTIFNKNKKVILYYSEGSEDPSKMGETIFANIDHNKLHKYTPLIDTENAPEEMLDEHRLLMDGFNLPRLPWITMKFNNQFLDRFFGSGEYSRRVVEIPGAFQFHRLPEYEMEILMEPLPNHVISRTLLHYLNFSDQMNMSQTGKQWLRQVRCNKNIEDSNVWFFKQFKKGVYDFFEMGNNDKFEEYQIWWFCSCKALINDLWEKWERFLGEETTLMHAINNNQRCWYSDDDMDTDDY